jgi:hypothetical protein
MADNTAKITAIQAILRAGAKSVTTHGVTVVYDLADLRKELRQLMAEDDTHGAPAQG